MLLHEEPWIEFLWARLGIIYCVVNDILTALDNDNIPVILLLDLSAAFDTIDHQILLSRLYSLFGIQSTALKWFESYLSDKLVHLSK